MIQESHIIVKVRFRMKKIIQEIAMVIILLGAATTICTSCFYCVYAFCELKVYCLGDSFTLLFGGRRWNVV